jgi:hypothetical protein
MTSAWKVHGGADQDGLYHSVGISVAGVKFVEAGECGGTNGEDQTGGTVSAMPGKNPNRGCVTRGGPVDVLPGEVMNRIESTRVIVIMRAADLALEFDAGTVR